MEIFTDENLLLQMEFVLCGLESYWLARRATHSWKSCRVRVLCGASVITHWRVHAKEKTQNSAQPGSIASAWCWKDLLRSSGQCPWDGPMRILDAVDEGMLSSATPGEPGSIPTPMPSRRATWARCPTPHGPHGLHTYITAPCVNGNDSCGI